MTELPPPPPPQPEHDTLVAELTGHTSSKMASTPLKPWTSTPRKRYRLVDASLIGTLVSIQAPNASELLLCKHKNNITHKFLISPTTLSFVLIVAITDPKDGTLHTHVTIDIHNGAIHRMTKLQAHPSPGDEVLSWTQNDSALTIINLDGKFVVPGLIDCHVHLATPPGEDGLKDTMNQDPNTSLLRQPFLAHQMLTRGFTSIRDCGGAGIAMKEALAEGLYPGPRLFTSGHGISQTGGHGDLRGSKDDEYACCGGNTHGLGRIADGVEQCLHAAREELRQGADFIKIMVRTP